MAFPFIFCPKKAEFLDFDRMFSFPNVQFSSVVNSEISALLPFVIDGLSILKTSLLAVNLLTITSSGKIVSKAPKALSNPMVPSLAKSNSNFLSSISSGLWSEVIQSIVPSKTASTKAFLVASSRNGGNTLYLESNPINISSFKTKL